VVVGGGVPSLLPNTDIGFFVLESRDELRSLAPEAAPKDVPDAIQPYVSYAHVYAQEQPRESR
jgi:hypothetical protein